MVFADAWRPYARAGKLPDRVGMVVDAVTLTPRLSRACDAKRQEPLAPRLVPATRQASARRLVELAGLRRASGPVGRFEADRDEHGIRIVFALEEPRRRGERALDVATTKREQRRQSLDPPRNRRSFRPSTERPPPVVALLVS